jgi:alpha-glucosidase
LPFKISGIEVDNVKVALKDVKLNGNNTIEVKKDFTELHITGK